MSSCNRPTVTTAAVTATVCENLLNFTLRFTHEVHTWPETACAYSCSGHGRPCRPFSGTAKDSECVMCREDLNGGFLKGGLMTVPFSITFQGAAAAIAQGTTVRFEVPLGGTPLGSLRKNVQYFQASALSGTPLLLCP